MKKFSVLVLVLFIALFSNAQIPNTLSPSDKVHGLSLFWQEVNYNFVNLDKIGRTKWDSTYKVLINTVQNTANDYEYYRELQKFCAMLKDGHTNVFFPEKIESEVRVSMFGDYRLIIENKDSKAIITHVNLSKKNEISVGSEIVEVNGKTTEKYIKENVAPYISTASDDELKDMSIYFLLKGLVGDTFNIKIKMPTGEIKSLKLIHKDSEEKELYPAVDKEVGLLDFKWCPNQIAYLALNSFNDTKIDSLFIKVLPGIYKAKGLIIDLRYNGGGDETIALKILKYFTNNNDSIPVEYQIISRNNISSYKAWGQLMRPEDTINDEYAKKCFLISNDTYYDYEKTESYNRFQSRVTKIVVPTVILIGPNTASAAEQVLIYLANQKHIVKMGESTNGVSGQPIKYDLPGGGMARICPFSVLLPDGSVFGAGQGIKPDIEIKTPRSYTKPQIDTLMDKALEYLKGKIN